MDVKNIIKKMSLADKIALCSGENFWETKKMEQYGIPSLFMCDGPHGLRRQDLDSGTDMLGVNESRPSTCFPCAVTTAQSWDTSLTYEVAKAISEEAKAQKVGLVLGPGANIKRNPLNGRNFEYFSEDPYLSGKLAASFIRGAEENGIATSLKHFACNNQELNRFSSNSVIDERTLREIYLTSFEIAVKEGKPSTVMCAYNKINDIHCSDNKQLLTTILRDEWGFDGMVVTDWGAMNDRIEAFKAGCDLNMPGGSNYMEKNVVEAVQQGSLSEEDIDKSVERILNVVFQTNDLLKKETKFDVEEHHKLAVYAATQGVVLLKNENILPLNDLQKIAVIGDMAKDPRYQGAGSSHINPTKLPSPVDCFKDAIYAQGCDSRGTTSESLIKEAVNVAKQAEVAIIFAGLPAQFESEGFDKETMQMPSGHLEMIEAVSNANPNTIVVLLGGSVLECPWAEKVKAVLTMGLPGQGIAEAIVDIIYGKVNPSGKLAESWPLVYSDCGSSSYYSKSKDALYYEGIYLGYRYYDKANKPVRWPFGYGLSYTTFSYSNLKIEDKIVSVTITNTGKVEGKEIAQLYVGFNGQGLHCPVKELKGFKKVSLRPNESETVEFQLDERSFAIWQDGWKIQNGIYTIYVGPNSAELPLTQQINIQGKLLQIPSWQENSWYMDCKEEVSFSDWEKMIGRKYIEPTLKKGQFTMDNSVAEMRDFSIVMKIMYKAIESTIAKGFNGKKDYENPNFRMMMNASAESPLRSMQISGGKVGVNAGIFEGLLAMANGHYIKGIMKMIKG